MILVRDELQCEAGQVNEFVNRFREMATRLNNQDVIKRVRVLTDLSGRFDTVVVESEVESVDAYLALLRATFADPDLQAAQEETSRITYQSGSRTFYTIEAAFDMDG